MLGCLVLTVIVAAAQVEATDDLRLQVRRLVRQLDAAALSDREAAEDALLKLGPAILDLLPPGAGRTSAEVAQRIERIRQQLERRMGETAIDASYVTLTGSLPISEILAAFEEQTGNRISTQRVDPDKLASTLEVDFDNAPFWQALDQVLDGARLGVYPYGGDGAVQLVAQPESLLPRTQRASYTGPFRFEAVTIAAERDLRNPLNESLRLGLEVAWEPRLRPVALQQRMVDVEASDEHGDPLAIDLGQAVLEVPVGSGATTVPLVISLKPPPRAIQRIQRLRGRLTALVPGRAETFRFENLEAQGKVEKRIAGVTVQLEPFRRSPAIWEARLRVRFDEANDALASHRNWIFENEVRLETPGANPVDWATFETTAQSRNEVGVAYYFNVEGSLAGYALVYRTPAVILSADVEYEVRKIDLP